MAQTVIKSEHVAITEKWSSDLGFILAVSGSAIGMANIWKFPYTMGQSGGSAFLLCYMIATVFLALPGMVAETMIGRRGATFSPFGCVDNVMKESSKSAPIIAMIYSALGFVSTVLLAAYYPVVGGWSIDYMIESAKGFIPTLQSQDESFKVFINLVGSPITMFFCTAGVIVPAVVIVGMGVDKGIEKFTRLFLGIMFAFIIVLFGYAVASPGFGQAVTFMFKPDFSKITMATIIEATGQSFFTVSVGFCGIVVYGSMLDKKQNIFKNSLIVAVINTVFSLIIGVAIFSLVFTKGINPAAGPSLVFGVLPLVLQQLPMSSAMGVLFFFMVYLVALTSVFNIVEVSIKFIMGWGFSRMQSAIAMGVVSLVLCWLPILGFNVLGDVRIVPFGLWKDMQIFDVMDYWTSNIFFPINAIILFIITGWFTAKTIKEEEIEITNPTVYAIFDILCKFVAPISVTIVMIAVFMA